MAIMTTTAPKRVTLSLSAPHLPQIESPGSPSMTCWRSTGRSPGFQSDAVWTTPVAKRTAIGTIAARDRAWNAHELGSHFIAGEPHRRIAVAAQVDEFEMRSKVRIGNGVRALQVEALRVFEARADAVLEEHVVRPIGGFGRLVDRPGTAHGADGPSSDRAPTPPSSLGWSARRRRN